MGLGAADTASRALAAQLPEARQCAPHQCQAARYWADTLLAAWAVEARAYDIVRAFAGTGGVCVFANLWAGKRYVHDGMVLFENENKRCREMQDEWHYLRTKTRLFVAVVSICSGTQQHAESRRILSCGLTL